MKRIFLSTLMGFIAFGLPLSPPAWASTTVDSTQPIDGIAAIVNSDIITLGELNQQYQSILKQLTRREVPMPPEAELRQQVLNRMITDKIQLQKADQLGIRVDDQRIEQTMERVAQQNNMNLDDFLKQLRSDGISPERFRTEIEHEIILGQLKEREVERRLQVSDSEVQAWLATQTQGGLKIKPQVNWVQVLIKAPKGQETSADTEKVQAIEDSLEKTSDLEAVFERYPELQIDGTGRMGWSSFDEVPSLFLDFLNNGKTDEVKTIRSPNGFHVLKILGRRQSGLSGLNDQPMVQTLARHILIRPDESISEEEARRQLGFVLDTLRNENGSFAELAKQYSADASAAKGGDLGWIYPGDTVPEFERVMNSLQPGEVSDVFESRFGLHIIQVQERREKAVPEDRQRLAAKQAILSQKAQEAYRDWIQKLRDEAFVDIRL